ncbi:MULTISPECIES: carbohydrate ABC transporter permease [Caldilinea]|jgi:multiple sugar transport system permease protein|uniref:Putative ABC transporter permease protein n=1 Tax=Caldilinea aerophila (strain DSM 14535 / JCM 11387 / NBRC 104270 / STL-6-O1) TaxID=926550 RepID=I0I7A3_CALAS|nr:MULTISPECIES: sugar ABC transporter permease [Caldilinea]MBO9393870.1 sugar ABC transporter permease [Caldilinea sp.]BAM01141.1 putative ABC transporter permease protein [Caldilinea aerophila DSM 14535 = NBRC 104270]GIV72480.1 MAG: ABC transporter permease [Caldilinea sp.]
MATGIKQQDRQDAIAGWLFMTPALFLFAFFVFIPIFFAIYFSFTDWNGISPPTEARFIGAENFRVLLLEDGIRRADFFKALKNTAYFSLGVVPLQTALALLLAVVVNQRRLRFKGFFRTAYYFPSITSSIAISMLFLFLYQRNGLVNQVLQTITFGLWQPIAWMADPRGLFHIIFEWFGLTLETAPAWMRANVLSLPVWDWISGPSVALTAIMLLNTWTTIGTMMVIFLAALQDVPREVYEAAEIDGANSRQIFFRVTLPLLRPTLFFVVTLGLIGTFQVFDQVYVMSAGGPAKTTLTVAYLVYRNGFTNSQMGLAAAIALLLFIIIFTLTLVQRRITEGKKE